MIFPWIGESIRIIPISLTNSVLRKHLCIDINEGVSIAALYRKISLSQTLKTQTGGCQAHKIFLFESSEDTVTIEAALNRI